MSEDKKHGGLRKGAGRKVGSKRGVNTKAVTLHLSLLAVDILSKQSNKSKFVSELIEKTIGDLSDSHQR